MMSFTWCRYAGSRWQKSDSRKLGEIVARDTQSFAPV